ncbi:DNA-3-methyladenine glycosylase 2 family protein [Pseudomonas luteola]|uniref:DNA-3-methyladenine glycosylase family protein n=1 Tax=Pseudomonas luteola TaxID=47886 RepID=UPI001EF6486F|nr:DNA-3-methyladenine glycosylase 2 family protein [Pseudomonas luteola]MCG7374133.1 DNA-3-methyladenine glycosylase 2 family protein [Pseudomonas luteola]
MNTNSVKMPEIYENGIHALKTHDSRWHALIEMIGPCDLQHTSPQETHEALIKAVAYQQLHAKAGDAILKRFRKLFSNGHFPTCEEVLLKDKSEIKACGFSETKASTILCIAEAGIAGVIPRREKVVEMSEEQLIAKLIQLKGVGRWTVEMMLIYGMGKQDVMPSSDFGIREGYRRLYDLPEQPKPNDISLRTKELTPYRTLAAWYLWRVPRDFQARYEKEFESKQRSEDAGCVG